MYLLNPSKEKPMLKKTNNPFAPLDYTDSDEKKIASESQEQKSITEKEEGGIESEEKGRLTDGESLESKEEGVEEEKRETNLDKYLIKLQKVSLRDKIFFTKNLNVMIKAGLSLSQALHALAEQTPNKKFKKILWDVEQKVKKGQNFADSLKQYPKTFNELFISMIAAGEVSGNLEGVLNQLHTQMTRDHELISKIRGAMIYPIIVITAMVGIGTAMVIFVIPKFISIFEEVQAELPLPTRILINLSHFVTKNGIFLAIGLIVIIVILIKIFRTQAGRTFLHKLFLKLPILSTIVKKINLARFSRCLSSLLKTDIPIVEAFNISARVLGNIHYKNALFAAAEKIKKGERVHKCLAEKIKLFPPVVIQMVTVGEESGSLDSILEELANFYEDDIDQTMKNLPAIIEPILMLILGAGVAGIAMAVLMPMYSLSQSI